MRGLGVRTVGDYVAGRRPRRVAGRARAARPALTGAGPCARAAEDRPSPRPLRLLSCDKCLPACPNDANFVFETEPLSRSTESFRVAGAGPCPCPAAAFEPARAAPVRHLPGLLATTAATATRFCPEDGGRTSRSRASTARSRPSEAGPRRRILRRAAGAVAVMWGRLARAVVTAEVDPEHDQAVFSTAG